MKKHVLFIVENATVPPDLRVWSEALSAKEFGYDVTVLSPQIKKTQAKYEIIDDIEIYRHPMPIEANAKLAFLFEYLIAIIYELIFSIKIFIKKPFHIIHSANPPDNIFLIALLYKIFGIKFIFDHHDICLETYLTKFGRKDTFYYILLILEKLSFKTADAVISTNESYKKIAITRGKKNRNEVFIVRNGPDLTKLKPMNPNEGLKIKGDFEYLVAYIGMIGNQERIDILLNAVEYIVYEKKIKNIKFVIIGTGPYLQTIVELSKKMKLEKFVTFTGFIPFPDYYGILNASDIGINPEFINEYTDKSTMIKIMDYMVAGKPIVQFETKEGKVSACEASVYIKENNVIQFAEAIIELLNDVEKREKMGRAGRKRIEEKLNWDNQKAKLKEAYEYLEKKNE